ncbi:MAG: hypothetical protein DRJ52_05385, partial [Thermoprotei archaeon]
MVKKIKVRLYVDSLDSPIVKTFREAVDVFTYVYGEEAIEADIALSLSRIDLPVVTINGIEVVKSKIPRVDELVSVFIDFYHRVPEIPEKEKKLEKEVVKTKPKPPVKKVVKEKEVPKPPPVKKPPTPEKKPTTKPPAKIKKPTVKKKPAPKPKRRGPPVLLVIGKEDADYRILCLNTRSAVNALKILYNTEVKVVEVNVDSERGQRISKKLGLKKYPSLVLGKKVLYEGTVPSSEKILETLKSILVAPKLVKRPEKLEKKAIAVPLVFGIAAFISLLLMSTLITPFLVSFFMLAKSIVFMAGFEAEITGKALVVDGAEIPFSYSYALIPTIVAALIIYMLTPRMESKDKVLFSAIIVIIIVLLDVLKITLIAFTAA